MFVFESSFERKSTVRQSDISWNYIKFTVGLTDHSQKAVNLSFVLIYISMSLNQVKLQSRSYKTNIFRKVLARSLLYSYLDYRFKRARVNYVEGGGGCKFNIIRSSL